MVALLAFRLHRLVMFHRRFGPYYTEHCLYASYFYSTLVLHFLFVSLDEGLAIAVGIIQCTAKTLERKTQYSSTVVFVLAAREM